MERKLIAPDLEKRILLWVLASMDAPSPAPGKHVWLITVLLWLAVGTSALVLFQAFGQSKWLGYAIPVTCFAVGAFGTASAAKALVSGLWPVVGQHIDRSKVEARLRELGV
ncbi:hypothetical protein ASD78_14370 [Lysobacter sp. Root667]|uniref:hypothetical protein n=1 Tax=Lysobacter sp. Root667 TaxID=1736581 RepID=UPI0006FE0B2D|nr:hypothetical protein [Lysobacter sp. Root667]KRA72808.1 hypothetical protein ASD78_14370 [Lysobacter sp. Root667]